MNHPADESEQLTVTASPRARRAVVDVASGAGEPPSADGLVRAPDTDEWDLLDEVGRYPVIGIASVRPTTAGTITRPATGPRGGATSTAPGSGEVGSTRSMHWKGSMPAEPDLQAARSSVPASSPEPLEVAEENEEDLFDASLLEDFVAESRDLLRGAEEALLELETDPTAVEPINVVFRAFHTIKGTAGFLDLEPVTRLAHLAESLLDRFRLGEMRCTGPRADLALRSVDMLHALLNRLTLTRTVHGSLTLPPAFDQLVADLSPGSIALLVEVEAPRQEKLRLGDILVQEGRITRERLEAVFASKGDEAIGLALVRDGAVSLQDVARALRMQQNGGAVEAVDSSLRVPRERLDQLFATVSRLVALHRATGALPADAVESERVLAESSRIVGELQALSASLRTVPLRETFRKMARVVRDVARRTGKEVEFVTRGEEIEVDRGIAELVADPLVHMIRNAIDHGIEVPDARGAAGKPLTGAVRLSATRTDDEVVLELIDDGGGLDRDLILARALDQGLVEQGSEPSDAEVHALLFAPGFSTVASVTELSGRGVGLDVVKRNIESVGGRVEIRSERGVGTTFTIRFAVD